jgi:outer membrane autotransporter protein
MKPGYVAFVSVLTGILIAAGAVGTVRADVLVANGTSETAPTGKSYSTSTSQPAIEAINGGTILSTGNSVTILALPPGGMTGVEAAGPGSEITANTLTVHDQLPTQTGISAVSAVGGGVVNLNAGTIGIAGSNSIGLLSNNGTITVSGPLTISMTGINSYGVEASGSGVVRLNPGTNISTSGPGGLGIFAVNGGTVTANGIAITTSGLVLPGGFNSDGAATIGGTISLANSSITTSGVNADGLHVLGGNGKITGTNLTIMTSGLSARGAEVDNGGVISLNGGIIGITGASNAALLANNASIMVSGPLAISVTGINSYGAEATNSGLVQINPGATIATSGLGGLGIFAANGGVVTANGITITTSGLVLPGGFNADGAATMGGTISLANSSIITRGDRGDGLHVLGGSGQIFGTNLTIVTAGRSAAGAAADNGGLIQLSGGSISTSGAGSYGLLASNGGNIAGSGISVTTSGGLIPLLNTADGAAALTGPAGPGTINLANSTIEADGLGANGLFVSGAGSTISIANSNIVSSQGNGARVENGANLTLSGSSLTALIHGIVAAGGTLNTPNSILVSGGSLTTVFGDAFQVLNGVTNITVNNGATVTGTTALLRVLDPPTDTVVNLNASHASLNGDIFADPVSRTAVNLTNSSVLTGRVNPGLGLGGSLTIDGGSEWVMTGSSNLRSLTLSPGARAVFSTLFNLARNTLTLGDLSGTGGTFGLNINLRRGVGDLIDITGTSQGSYSLTFFDRGTDLPRGQSLLVVETADGVAKFSGTTDLGVYKYDVVRGNGSAIRPNPDDWYLVRVPVLSNAANAAIGTYGASTPLFYADMDTLIQRLGELRLLSGESRLSLDSGGKAIVPSAPAQESFPTIGTWVRGFGNGMRINDEASRGFDQNTGGFQLGADVRFNALHGDLYVGGFVSYFNASRDFLDNGNGSTNAISAGTYATWLNPQGWYADLVLKYTQLWNFFFSPGSNGIISSAQYSVPALGGSLEVGKRFDMGEFFIEPGAQLAGAWVSGNSYTASNGLNVGGSDQYSLRGRLGLRAGMHFSLSNGMALEPYLKVSAVQEFLTGDQINLDDIPFFPTVSGTMVDAAAGISGRLSQSLYLYGEYDYANGNRIRQPWALSLGLRWEWGGQREEPVAEQPVVNQPTGKEAAAKQVELPPAKPAKPWEITVGGPGWLANVNANIGTHGHTIPADVGVGQILRNMNAIDALNAEVHKEQFSLLGGYLYINAQSRIPGEGLVTKTDISLQEFISQLAAGWRIIDGPHGWLDALGGFRFWYVGSQSTLQANQAAINNSSTMLVNQFAEQLTTPISNLRNLIQQNLNLDALKGRNPPLPVPPLADREADKIRNSVQAIIQSQESELAAAIRTNAQARVNQLKSALASQVANFLTRELSRSFSLYENWFDPFIGIRGRYNLTKALYLTGEADVGGFGVGSEITWQVYSALGCQITRNIYSEVGYRYLYLDYDTTSFIFQGSYRGAQVTVGVRF